MKTAPESRTGASASTWSVAISWVHPGATILPLAGVDPVVIGRGEEANFVIQSNETSTRHAELRWDDGTWVVSDLGSTNGTYVDGKPAKRTPLVPGAVLRCGGGVGVVVTAPSSSPAFPGLFDAGKGYLVGPSLRRLLADVELAAQHNDPIIVEGETGSGKERLANWIHERSRRAGPFVAVNCAAIPESLAEAELFGYRRGAFTGATQASLGHFRAANGGTLLLDEIVELPLSIQAKLLRVLEERRVTPLGETNSVDVDVRVVVAAQSPLDGAVAAGSFRGDLFARLEGFPFSIPPLRERIEDVYPLFCHFVRERSGGKGLPEMQSRFVEALCLYDWPFNVRELLNIARQLLVLRGHEGSFKRAHLPHRMLKQRTGDVSAPPHMPGSDPLERLLFELRRHKGNVKQAAEAAGIERARAYRLMAQNEVDLVALRAGEGDPR